MFIRYHPDIPPLDLFNAGIQTHLNQKFWATFRSFPYPKVLLLVIFIGSFDLYDTARYLFNNFIVFFITWLSNFGDVCLIYLFIVIYILFNFLGSLIYYGPDLAYRYPWDVWFPPFSSYLCVVSLFYYFLFVQRNSLYLW